MATESRRHLAAEGGMTIEAAVAFSGIGRSRLYELMRDGLLTYSTNGNRRLILKASLVELLAGGIPTD